MESKQILNIILNRTDKKGWQNHPAVKMWVGYAPALKLYFNAMRTEWISRGYNNTMPEEDVVEENIVMPGWLSNPRFCSSHRAALLFKDFEYYSRFGWTEKPELNYWWGV